MKYAAYVGSDWQFDLEADDDLEALEKARLRDPRIDRVELVSKSHGARDI